FYLGHKLAMGDVPAHKITEWQKELGPIIKVKMGAQDWIFVGDSSMVHDIYSMDPSLTSDKPHFIFGNPISRNGQRHVALADDGSRWKDARSAVLHMLSPSSVKEFSQGLQDEAQRMVNQLIKRTQHHGSVDPLSIIQCTSINVILSMAFSHPGVRSPYDPLYKCIMDVSGARLEHGSYWRSFPILSYIDRFFRNGHQTKRFVNPVGYSQVQKLIQKARESKSDNLVKKIDLMSKNDDIDEHYITVMMSELLVAGTDAVSSSTAWTFATLCHYPDVQRKLAEEIDNFIRKHYRIPTFDDRLELPYYNAVQKECLRIRPPVYFGIPRRAIEDVVYRNYLIPKGSIIVSNIHALHNDEYAFTEPEKFIPERFLHDKSTMHARANGKLENRDHHAFGWNNRVCPGIALAEHEMFNIVTRVMARCTIKPANLPNGQHVYPNLKDIRSRGAAVVPGPFRLQFIERDNRLIV
ncbi:cytochrome P450, partial [Parasitella parasitica]